MRIVDRKEFASKAKPLTCTPETTVFDAVTRMAEKNFGSILITDPNDRILGVMTERDIFRRVIGESRDPQTTAVNEVMTSDVRMANENDDVLEWLQIMSNERFRRLPIVDDDKRLVAVMSQGDFVSYTWPQLLGQVGQMAQATLAKPVINPVMILSGIAIYTILLIVVLLYLT